MQTLENLTIHPPVEWEEMEWATCRINNTDIRYEYLAPDLNRVRAIHHIVTAVMQDLQLGDLDKPIRIIIPQIMESLEYETGKTMIPGGTAHNGYAFYTVEINRNMNRFSHMAEIVAHELRHVWQYTQGWDSEWDKPYMERKIEIDAYAYGAYFRENLARQVFDQYKKVK